MEDIGIPYPVRHYEVTTLLDALSVSIVDMFPTSHLQQQFLQMLKNNHTMNIFDLPSDEDSHQAGEVAMEAVHRYLRRKVARLNSQPES